MCIRDSLISDLLGGIGGGFRTDNSWLAALTGHALPATFYAGDALGSFNSVARLVTGAFFGLGIVWFLYPRFQAATSRFVERESVSRI